MCVANRFDGRIKRLEALRGEEVDAILDRLAHEQGQALLILMMALLNGVEEPSDECFQQTSMSRERYKAAIANIPEELQERFIAAFVARVEKADRLKLAEPVRRRR
jgi:hypothetical protein